MKELYLAFMLMASQLSGLPPAKDLPTMAFLPPDQICVALDMCDTDMVVFGHYDMESRRLTLLTEWSLFDLRDLGALIHEMVHHLQAEKWPDSDTRPCDGLIEGQAYRAEHEFLRAMKMAPDIDQFTLLVLTLCDD